MTQPDKPQEPLDYTLTMQSIAITGSTSCPDELEAFIERLKKLADFLPEKPTPKEPVG